MPLGLTFLLCFAGLYLLARSGRVLDMLAQAARAHELLTQMLDANKTIARVHALVSLAQMLVCLAAPASFGMSFLLGALVTAASAHVVPVAQPGWDEPTREYGAFAWFEINSCLLWMSLALGWMEIVAIDAKMASLRWLRSEKVARDAVANLRPVDAFSFARIASWALFMVPLVMRMILLMVVAEDADAHSMRLVALYRHSFLNMLAADWLLLFAR